MKAKKTSESERVVSMRFAAELVERIEKHHARLRAANPSFTISMSDAVRDIVRAGLDALEPRQAVTQ